MHLEINDDVKKWMRSKGSQITVKVLEVKGCCAPNVQDLVVLPVKPKDIQHYQEITVDDLSIYVHKPIAMSEKLTFQLKGFGIFKMVSVKAQ